MTTFGPLWRGSLAVLCALGIAPAIYAQTSPASTLRIIRRVEVAPLPLDATRIDSAAFADVIDGQTFSSGLLRTRKRSRTQIARPDGVTVRLDEKTTVRVQDAAVHLIGGELWADVPAGATLTVETANATATASGATFVLSRPTDDPNATSIVVLAGTVKMTHEDLQKTVTAGAAFTARKSPTRMDWGGADAVRRLQAPTELGGPTAGWWQAMPEHFGLRVFPGTPEAQILRASPLIETLFQKRTLPPLPSKIGDDPARRQQFLKVAQTGVVPTLEAFLSANPTKNLGDYVGLHGGEAVEAQFPVGGDDLVFLQDNGIRSISDLFSALGSAGAAASIGVRHRPLPAGRAVYRSGSAIGNPEKARLFDGTQSNYLLLGLAAAAALANEARSGGLPFDLPGIDATGFGFTGDIQLAGARAALRGSAGRTRYAVEANLARTLGGNNETFEAISVASIERALGSGVTAFAGRRRFYQGPVSLNLLGTQLVADRYSALGASVRRGIWRGEAAYLYDANPDVAGAQSGFLAALSRGLLGGQVGVQFLRVGKLRDGNGLTLSGSYPAVRNVVDVYAEVGRLPDRSGVHTVGVYLPGLFERSDIDVFAEMSSRRGKSAFSLIAARNVWSGLTAQVHLTALDRKGETADIQGGIALAYRFSAR